MQARDMQASAGSTRTDVVITGASRGIGRSLALALAGDAGLRLVLVARDAAGLGSLAAEIERQGGACLVVAGDLGSRAGAARLGQALLDVLTPGATLVHNAGLWPTERRLGPDGLEEAFFINHVGPLLLQQPLLDAGRLSRIMVVSAGLIARGRFNAEKTPTGADFGALHTYCTTKLCFAVEMRRLAASYPDVDIVALHPGVVRTDLGVAQGFVGWLLRQVKRAWESPEACGTRLAGVVRRPRWSPPGAPKWLHEDQETDWPATAEDAAMCAAIHKATADILTEPSA